MTPASKGKQYPIDPYTRDEIYSLLGACSPRRRGPCRMRTMMILMWRTGIRVGECCSLQLHDLRLDQPGGRPNSLRVQRPKGAGNGKEPREVGLDEGTCNALRLWMNHRGLEPGFLFSTSTGGQLGTAHMRRMIPRIARRVGITRRCHAHAFRHTFCRELGNEGVDIVHRMEALGHSSLTVTTRYAKSCGDSPAVAVCAGREW